MSATLPNWVYDLIAAVAQYEDQHGPCDGWDCLQKALCDVPEREHDRALTIHDYLRAKARAEVSEPPF